MKTIDNIPTLDLPKDFMYYEGEDIMSNFDRVIDKKTEAAIKGKKLYSHYPAYNFHGVVWYQNNQWHCRVSRHGCHVATFSESDLNDLMNVCSENYGYE